jgi:protein-glutamine gamma-glutamyltransferase
VILITGSDADQINMLAQTSLERVILQKKQSSSVVYKYESLEAFDFELEMRSKLVAAAIALNDSGIRFATFKNSKCNDQFWNLTEKGGFKLRDDVTPTNAILDIFRNGHLYACECATAMVIVLYKGVIDSIGKERFNANFENLLLWDWNYDSDLRLKIMEDLSEAYPGDILYFENPDYDPKTPEWQGENAVMISDNLYYGHGIGIRTADAMIEVLNRKRKPDSTTSAFLSDQVVYPDYEYIRKLTIRRYPIKIAYSPIIAIIGDRAYIHGNAVLDHRHKLRIKAMAKTRRCG